LPACATRHERERTADLARRATARNAAACTLPHRSARSTVAPLRRRPGRLRRTPALVFAQLQPLTGKLGARGRIDGTLRALSDGASSAAQTSGLHFSDASIAGVPLRSATATATLQGQRLDVRALQLELPGNRDRVRLARNAGTRGNHERAAGNGGTVRANARVHGTSMHRTRTSRCWSIARAYTASVFGKCVRALRCGTLHVNDATRSRSIRTRRRTATSAISTEKVRRRSISRPTCTARKSPRSRARCTCRYAIPTVRSMRSARHRERERTASGGLHQHPPRLAQRPQFQQRQGCDLRQPQQRRGA